MAGGYPAFANGNYNGIYISMYSTGGSSYISGGAYIRDDVGSLKRTYHFGGSEDDIAYGIMNGSEAEPHSFAPVVLTAPAIGLHRDSHISNEHITPGIGSPCTNIQYIGYIEGRLLRPSFYAAI